jgi:hypothetical protein
MLGWLRMRLGSGGSLLTSARLSAFKTISGAPGQALIGVAVGVSVRVLVNVGVRVEVAVGVAVTVGRGVDVLVMVAVVVGDGVTGDDAEGWETVSPLQADNRKIPARMSEPAENLFIFPSLGMEIYPIPL